MTHPSVARVNVTGVLRVDTEQFFPDESAGSKHLSEIRGHAPAPPAISREMLPDDYEVIVLRNAHVEQKVFASLAAIRPECGVVPAALDDRMLAHEGIASAADDVPTEDCKERVSLAGGAVRGRDHRTPLVDLGLPGINQPDTGILEHGGQLLLDFCPFPKIVCIDRGNEFALRFGDSAIPCRSDP